MKSRLPRKNLRRALKGLRKFLSTPRIEEGEQERKWALTKGCLVFPDVEGEDVSRKDS